MTRAGFAFSPYPFPLENTLFVAYSHIRYVPIVGIGYTRRDAMGRIRLFLALESIGMTLVSSFAAPVKVQGGLVEGTTEDDYFQWRRESGEGSQP